MNLHSRFAFFLAMLATGNAAAGPIAIGDRVELFVDQHLIERMENVRLVLGTPRLEGVAFRFDQPWEGPHSAYVSVIKDANVYRMYYRGMRNSSRDYADAVTCYAESRDGITWTKPVLRQHRHGDNDANNIIWLHDSLRISDNFAPFLDSRPGVPRSERYKAVGGNRIKGLFRLVSENGIRWRLFSDQGLFAGYALDSMNVPMWLPEEKLYAIYLRTSAQNRSLEQPESYQRSVRSVSRSVSKDFVHWSEPTPMDFGDGPLEHLYTTATHPYFRAPHILIALPMRLVPNRQVLSVEQMDAWGVGANHRSAVSDAVLMSSRGGHRYDRTFLEAFIRPGEDRKAWFARNLFPARGVVPTGEREMSIYVTTHYSLSDAHIQRYSLRLDGFVAAKGPYGGGVLVTKPVTFSGGRLVINYATSAAGSVAVELLDAQGLPLANYSAGECEQLVGDEIEREVTWKGHRDVRRLAGRAVRIRLLLKDAELYSFRFAP